MVVFFSAASVVVVVVVVGSDAGESETSDSPASDEQPANSDAARQAQVKAAAHFACFIGNAFLSI